MPVLSQTAMSTDSKVSDLNEHCTRVILLELVGSLVRSEGLLPSQLNGTRSGALQSKLWRGEVEHQHIVRLEVKVGCSSNVEILQTRTDL